jgi:hypothetical protein
MWIYYRIKNFFVYGWDKFRRRCQRFKRGYSWGDVWDMDVWFMDVAKPMLIHLRDYGIGVPGELYQEGAENERGVWESILTEMIDCLTLMNEENVEKHLGIDLNDYSYESYKKVRDCMDENKNRFFELFSQYFYNLWD